MYEFLRDLLLILLLMHPNWYLSLLCHGSLSAVIPQCHLLRWLCEDQEAHKVLQGRGQACSRGGGGGVWGGQKLHRVLYKGPYFSKMRPPPPLGLRSTFPPDKTPPPPWEILATGLEGAWPERRGRRGGGYYFVIQSSKYTLVIESMNHTTLIATYCTILYISGGCICSIQRLIIFRNYISYTWNMRRSTNVACCYSNKTGNKTRRDTIHWLLEKEPKSLNIIIALAKVTT